MTTQKEQVLTWADAIEVRDTFNAEYARVRSLLIEHGNRAIINKFTSEKERTDRSLASLYLLEREVNNYMADKQHLLIANGELTHETLPLAYAIQSFYTSSLQALILITENFSNGK